jgi:hypothetical protein
LSGQTWLNTAAISPAMPNRAGATIDLSVVARRVIGAVYSSGFPLG